MVREELAKPLVDALKPWLEAELHRVAPRSHLADASAMPWSVGKLSAATSTMAG